MPTAYRLTPELRAKLKKPLGILIQGSFAQTMREFKLVITKEKPCRIIAVGDTVSRNLVQSRIIPQLSIVDNLAMRKNVPPISFNAERTMYIRNPQGTITDEAITSIEEALKGNQRSRIVVEGEEDLLTLISVLYAPENSIVIYGQPYEGIVVVKVTPKKKEEIWTIMKAMENERKDK